MSTSGTTILLTGATGYLGSRLLKHFLDRGDTVIAVVRDRARLSIPQASPGSIEVVEGDITSPIAAPPALRADVLVHAAALVDYGAGESRLMAVNRDGARHAAALAQDLGVRRAVLISSLAAAGPRRPGEIPTPDGADPRPDTDYGRSKLAGESAFSDVATAAGIETIILRPGQILGDGELGMARPFFDALRSGDVAAFVKEWNQHRFQPVHVLDVVSAVAAAIRFGGTGTYNVTGCTTPTVGLLLRDVAFISRSFGLPVRIPTGDDAPPTLDEPIHYAHLCQRSLGEWNWHPTRTFPQTVIELAEASGLVRDATPHVLEGPLKVILCNTPTTGMTLSRDMAGGLGFVHNSEDRFPPLDLLWWAARLEDVGWPVTVIDGATTPFTAGDLLTHIANAGVDVIVCEVNLPTFEQDVEFLRTVRRWSRARVVAKTQLSYPVFLQRLLQEAGIPFVILGECDLTIERVLAGDDHRGTARLVNGELVITPEEKLVDLDRLPMPARKLIKPGDYSYSLLGSEGFTTIQTSRGCPYSCGYYCPYPMTQGKDWRQRSPAHVVRELEEAVALGYRHFLMRDATFTLSRKRTAEICQLIITKALPITFWCETRINCLDAELLGLLAAAGCKGINFGLESGDDDVLKSGAKQGVDVKRIRTILNETDKVGIISHLLVVVGLPQESRKSIQGTYLLLGELPAKTLGVTGITPFPGTELWSDAIRNNWVRSTNWAEYGGNQTVMVTDNLSQADIRFAAEMIFQYFQMTRPGSGATPAQLASHRERMAAWVAQGLVAAAT